MKVGDMVRPRGNRPSFPLFLRSREEMDEYSSDGIPIEFLESDLGTVIKVSPNGESPILWIKVMCPTGAGWCLSHLLDVVSEVRHAQQESI